jgi:Terminase large subunit, T4likevirus-type, N-terminal
MPQIQLTDPGNDFIREIKPNLRQEDFLQIPDSVFEGLYGGSAYSGKSFLLTLFPIIRGFYKFRGFKGIILRRKFPDLERENIRLSKEFYPKTGGVYNESKHVWEWKEHGSYVDFGHIQHSTDVRMYDSSQYNYCCFDELTSFTEDQYIYLVGSRVRPSSSFNIAIARSGTNPGGVGQTFVYNRFVRPDEKGYKLIRDAKTGLYRIFIPAYAQDNIQGMEYDPLYLQKLEMLPEAEKRAKKYGDWHAFRGSVFTTFRPIRFPNEPNNALHVIEQFKIPEWWPRLLSIDWGKRAMCHAMWIAISPNHRAYVYRERAWHGRDIPYWASEIRQINDEFNEIISHTTLCGSAWQSRGGELICDEFQKYSDLVPSSSENTPGSRVAGLQLIHDFLRWEKKVTLKAKGEFYDLMKAQEIYRRYGPEALENYKAQFYDEPEEDNLPLLQIFENCKILIDTIPMAIYDDVKIEDIAEFDGDDPIDNLRYACKAAKRFISGEISGLDLAAKKQKVIDELNMTGDMTAFYRQLEFIEAQNRASISDCLPVSRRSRFARRMH